MRLLIRFAAWLEDYIYQGVGDECPHCHQKTFVAAYALAWHCRACGYKEVKDDSGTTMVFPPKS